MGREWYSYLSSAKSTRRGRCRGGGGSFADNVGQTGSRNFAAADGAGCMSTLLHLFDVHHFHFRFCLHPQQHPHAFPSPSFLSDDDHPISLKGVEAPRNSLETEQVFKATASFETDEETFDTSSIPMGIYMKNGHRRDTKLRVQLPSNSSSEFSSSESSSSPGPRTPNLVARLMGLDVLPDGNSSANSVTPISSSLMPPRQQSSSPGSRPPLQARSSDVYSHRLSLQLPNVNRLSVGQFDLPRHSCSVISTGGGEYWSPGSYARQVVKQAKENIVMARKFGSDLTNKDEKIRETRREERLIMSLKNKKKSQKGNTETVIESFPLENSTPARSPRLQGVESKRKEASPPPAKDTHHDQPKAPIPRLSPPHLDLQSPIRDRERRRSKPFNGAGRSRLAPPKNVMDSITMKKDELFIRRPSPSSAAAADQYRRADKMGYEWKRPLLSSTSDVVPPATSLSRGSRSPSLKKLDSCSSASPPTSADVPQQVQKKEQPLEAEAAAAEATVAVFPATQLRSHYFNYCNKTIPTKVVTASYRTSTGTNAGNNADFEYMSQILNRDGIHRHTPPIFITNWFSSTHSLNRSIFYNDINEAAHFSSKGNNTNSGSKDHHHYFRLGYERRLPFHLADQILVDELLGHDRRLPYANPVPRGWRREQPLVTYGYHLDDVVWKRVLQLSSINHCALQDIDMMFEKDMLGAFKDIAELISLEIEYDTVDSLVRECLAPLLI